MQRIDLEQWRAKEVARLLALLETERRYYQEMVASLPVALVVLASDRSLVSANRAFRRSFGLRAEDLQGKTIDQILPSERLIEAIRSAHTGGAPNPKFVVELGERVLRVAAVPMRSWIDEGEDETLLMLEDLGGIERLRTAAPASRAVPADLPAIVWQADAATLKFTSVTGDAERLLGYQVSHWLTAPRFFSERIHPDDRVSTMACYQGAIARGGDAGAEYRALSASGDVVWCRETIRVSGRTITGVITDIGRRKQLEEQMLAAERTGALHGLAARLAHDLNNPLMIVTGYSEEILHTLGSQDVKRGDVEQILAATERISGLTGQLLQFTRKQANPPRPVDVTRKLSQLAEKIAVIPVTQAVWALADPDQLEEVILALVSAARAREQSRVTVACDVETIAESVASATLRPGVYARILIHGDGPGPEPEKRAALFESFLTAKDPEKGAGPALARAYAIVREWGGDIAFSSEPSQGSTFTVYLRHSAAESEAEAPEEPRANTGAGAGGETILLVEDEPGIRGLVRKILQQEQYHVLEASSAEEALKIAAAHKGAIHLLLTDFMLPGMTGRDLAERMHAASPKLKVLYVSGYTDDESVRGGVFPPGSRFLQKPFTLSGLVGKVREALGS